MNLKKSNLENSNSKTVLEKRYKNLIIISLLFLGLIISFLFSLRSGSYDISWEDLIKAIFSRASQDNINLIVQKNRLPRSLAAVIFGAGLSLSGAVLQGVLRNPMASPSSLGVSQGASFGAAFSIVILGFTKDTSFGVPISAFIGSLLVSLLILLVSKYKTLSQEAIILMGLAISSIFTGLTTIIQYFADEIELARLIYWTFGDLGQTDLNECFQGFIILIAFFSFAYFHRWDYNLLLSGKETAKSMGLNVDSFILLSMVISSFMSSFIVSKLGLISFVGLLGPHIAKRLVSTSYTYQLPACLLVGSIILLLADLISRTILSPVILPIGAITSILGGPLFIFLLYKGGRSHVRS